MRAWSRQLLEHRPASAGAGFQLNNLQQYLFLLVYYKTYLKLKTMLQLPMIKVIWPHKQ